MTNHKICVIIPVYNHAQKIAGVVQYIVELGLDCLLVDDGSDSECAAVLLDVSTAHERARLLRFDINRGKGVVICEGLTMLSEMGYTHALQVDADGQHDLNDLNTFVACSKRNPSDIISGWRSYESLPRSRRWGRRLTDVWVCIHTLSLSVKDSMCGYRVYPLVVTCSLLKQKTIARRMDFDTDILVRLCWLGVGVKHVPTRIIYSDDIPSHFQLFDDNVRITVMHTKLFFGMLVRLPVMLCRRLSRVFK